MAGFGQGLHQSTDTDEAGGEMPVSFHHHQFGKPISKCFSKVIRDKVEGQRENVAGLVVTHNSTVRSDVFGGKRILDQMRILGLETTLRVAVVAVNAQPDTLTERLRGLAESGKPGKVTS